MSPRFLALAFAASWLLVPEVAIADNEAAPAPVSHSLHWGVGVGGFTALTGPADWGPAAQAELYPGGRWGRYGVRAELWGFEKTHDGRVSVGLAFEAGASRPRLQLALHADIGLTFSDHRATIGGGIQTQLWVVGPLAIGLDGLAFLIYDGTDSILVIGSSLNLRLAN